MESRKKRLGPSKFGVRYENQRASWQSERTLAVSYLSTFWIIMKFRRSHEFSWLLRKYLFQLLTCRLSNSYDVNLAKNCLDSWMKNNPNGQTHLVSGSLLVSHWKHGLRKTRCSRDGHVSFLLDHDWFCSEKIREILWHLEVTKIRFEIIISQASHTFFPTRYLNLFF